MFNGDLTEDQHQQLVDMASIDVPEGLVAGAWNRSEFRVLLAMIAFAAIGHHPDRSDLADLTRLAKTTTAEALGRLCDGGVLPSWIEATDDYRVPARPRHNGLRGGGRRRQRYVVRPWKEKGRAIVLLASGTIQVDLGRWARRILITLGEVTGTDVVISGTGVRVVEIAEAVARRRLFELGMVHPGQGELQAAFKELQEKSLIGRCDERRVRTDPTTGASCVYRRVELRHPRLIWNRGGDDDRSTGASSTVLARRT
ncbi:MAG: hypothetical protein EA356_17715 [Geminicoccaceae bacterium]|nr:MAG: hypothetical protein EA356_17715 [Geminicoccaceae bacterium]